MTDLPAGGPGEFVDGAAARRCSPRSRELACDDGDHPQDAVAAHDGTLRRVAC